MTQQQIEMFEQSIAGLSVQDRRELIERLQRSITAEPPADETVFDIMQRDGLIGCIKGAPRSPTDLSTNPKHMEGFGRD